MGKVIKSLQFFYGVRKSRFLKLPFRQIHPTYIFSSFCCGIVFGSIIVFGFNLQFFSSALWLVVAVILLLFALKRPTIFTVLLAIISGFLVIGFRTCPDLESRELIESMIGRNVIISAKIERDPTESQNGKFNLVLTDITIGESKINGRIFTQISSLKVDENNRSLEISRSDYLTLTGTVAKGFGVFSGFLLRPTINSISRPEPGDLFLKFRNYFSAKVADYIPFPENGLALGYLLGQKSGVDQSFQDSLRVVGLTHIVVASGAHLGTLTSIARKLFGKLSRFASLLAASLLTLLFIGITGLSASMMRAGLVTVISLIFTYFGRKIPPTKLILIVATATLLANPFYLQDLAWLLSFASFFGILVVAPALTGFFYNKSKQPNFIFATLISSLAASLLCAPILLFYFGQISLISILANLLILPTISFTMGLTFLTGIFAIIFSPLAAIFGKIATLLLDYQIRIVNFFSEQKLFLITIDQENPIVLLLYIPLMIVIIIYACYSKYKLRRLGNKLA